MNLLRDYWNTHKVLHHAYCLLGNTASNKESLLDFIKTDLGIETTHNPDIRIFEYPELMIDDARVIRDAQMGRSFGGGKQFFIVVTSRINDQAQNALLKVLEEPTEDTHFFLLISDDTGLLPTLRSRLQFLYGADALSIEYKKEARNFIAHPIPERLELAKKWAKEVSDEKRTKAQINSFLDALEKELYADYTQRVSELKVRKMFENLLMVKGYMRTQGASVKMLLEYIAFLISPK